MHLALQRKKICPNLIENLTWPLIHTANFTWNLTFSQILERRNHLLHQDLMPPCLSDEVIDVLHVGVEKFLAGIREHCIRIVGDV